MSKVLHLDEARQHTLSAGPNHLLRLLPGRNVVDDDIFEAVLAGGKNEEKSQLAIMIEEGKIVVHGESLDITKKNAKDAVGVIEMETTVEGLQDLLVQEQGRDKPRKSILKAIQSKIESIEKAIAAEEKAEED